MSSGISLVGREFGNLCVLKETMEDIYLCLCGCGGTVEAFRSSLSKQVLRHCGCRLKHPDRKGTGFGHIRRYKGRNGRIRQKASGEYLSYASMRNRCLYKTTTDYPNYGARGIEICSRWLEPRGLGFRNFLTDMQVRPIGMTLDRIEVNGHYCKENCRWADNQTQTQNRRCMLFPGGVGEPPVIPMDDLAEDALACG
jgi:hypothetical protein